MQIHRTEQKRRFYRLQALRDIPEHGVKEGDWGGYVTAKDTLSPTGSSWIGGEAQVIGGVAVKGNSLVTDQAVVMNDYSYNNMIYIQNNVKISGRATVSLPKIHNPGYITDDVRIYDDAYVKTFRKISGTTEIYGKAYLDYSLDISNCKIFDNVKIGYGAVLSQVSVSGNAQIGRNANLRYSVISGSSIIGDNNEFSHKVFQDENIGEEEFSAPKPPKYVAPDAASIMQVQAEAEAKTLTTASGPSAELEAPPKVTRNVMMEAYEQVCEKIDAYESDIVKIIQFPVMADKTDTFTLEMVMALNTAKRYSTEPESSEFKDSVIALEKAFIMAESNARKIASSLMSDGEKKHVLKAKDLLRIAANESSSDNEKKIAFVQGFKQLEGVIAVPEVAIDTFRVKVGLKELES